MGFWGILGLIFLIILIIDVLGKNEDEKENEKKSLRPISSNSNDSPAKLNKQDIELTRRRRNILSKVDSYDALEIDRQYKFIHLRFEKNTYDKTSDIIGEFAQNYYDLLSNKSMFITTFKKMINTPTIIKFTDGTSIDFTNIDWNAEFEKSHNAHAFLRKTAGLNTSLFSDLCCVSKTNTQKIIDRLQLLAEQDSIYNMLFECPLWPKLIMGTTPYYLIFKERKLDTIKVNKVEAIEYDMNKYDYSEHIEQIHCVVEEANQTLHLTSEHYYHYLNLLDNIIKSNNDFTSFTDYEKRIFYIAAKLFTLIDSFDDMRFIDKEYDAPNYGFERSNLPNCQKIDIIISSFIEKLGAADYDDAKEEALKNHKLL